MPKWKTLSTDLKHLSLERNFVVHSLWHANDDEHSKKDFSGALIATRKGRREVWSAEDFESLATKIEELHSQVVFFSLHLHAKPRMAID